MAYNSYYPGYIIPNTTPAPQYQPQNQGIIWVQGEAAAKSYWVAPGNTVALWDSENPVIYLKSADAGGMPNIRVIDIKYREQQTTADSSYKALEERIAKLEAAIAERSGA